MIGHFQAQKLNCPYSECKNTVANATKVLQECQMELDQLYPPIEALNIEVDLVTDASHADKVISVTTLAGDQASFPYSPQMTVVKLKKEIQTRMNVAIDKQQLMYRDVVLEVSVNLLHACQVSSKQHSEAGILIRKHNALIEKTGSCFCLLPYGLSTKDVHKERGVWSNVDSWRGGVKGPCGHLQLVLFLLFQSVILCL